MSKRIEKVESTSCSPMNDFVIAAAKLHGNMCGGSPEEQKENALKYVDRWCKAINGEKL